MTHPNPGAVANLADLAARLVNSCALAAPDSTGQNMVKLRAALIAELQCALADLYPNPRDHNRTLANALLRRLA